jgi:hypothetical protein
MKYLKLYEAFLKDEIDKLINNGDTYLFKRKGNAKNQKNQELTNRLSNYNYLNFKYYDSGYGIFLYPDDVFLKIYKDACKLNGEIYNPNMHFYFTLTYDTNLIDFDAGIPKCLNGYGVATNIYLLSIIKEEFISSNKNVLNTAIYNTWYNLLQNENVYSATCDEISVAIYKNISDKRLKEILNLFTNYNLIYDNELKEKINNLNEMYSNQNRYN